VPQNRSGHGGEEKNSQKSGVPSSYPFREFKGLLLTFVSSLETQLTDIRQPAHRPAAHF
jgi:hypothetical protein